MRVISLVPSLTELLFQLGLTEEVVGITKFCVHPVQWHQTKTKVGGTKNINKKIIDGLNPTLIIANKEENVKDQIEALQQQYNVLLTDIYDFETAIRSIENIGNAVSRTIQAKNLALNIRKEFAGLLPLNQLCKTLYLIWQNPYMSVGADTFIHAMLEFCGLQNVCAAHKRYPTLTGEEIVQLNPQLVLLSSEPYPFKQKHIAAIQQLCPHAKILLADGEMFSWYGSRMLLAPGYFNGLFS